ncbi:hypothetical protein ACFP3Q_14510 [Nocardioides sp. GCM10027113]|uniref:TMEM164 family acyltransferase n=1 Tax=unclassified Nocardioides TaxID=2615069 RepID=UPI00361F311C
MVQAADFQTYGTSHQVAILVLVAGALALVAIGRRGQGTDPSDHFGKVFAVVMLAALLPLQILYFTPDYWNLQRTLPVQLCDIA